MKRSLVEPTKAAVRPRIGDCSGNRERQFRRMKADLFPHPPRAKQEVARVPEKAVAHVAGRAFRIRLLDETLDLAHPAIVDWRTRQDVAVASLRLARPDA